MEILTNLKSYNFTSTLNFAFKLMIFHETKCVYCTCEIQLRCELTSVNRLHQLCSILRTAYSTFVNLLFIVLLYWSCAILVSFYLYLSVISLIAVVQLFTHSLHSLPIIIYSPPEVFVMINELKKMLPTLEPVQSSPI